MAENIGVFGGAFNPIHNSHIYLALECKDKLGLDTIMMVPSGLPPHKPAGGLANGRHRLNMCGIAAGDLPFFRVTDFEVCNKGKSYTYLTLSHILKNHPAAKLFLILGADMFLTVQDWRCSSEIFRMAVICGARREDSELSALLSHKRKLENTGAECAVIDSEAMPLSSTQVRGMIRAGDDVTGLIHPGVLRYIKDNGLYV